MSLTDNQSDYRNLVARNTLTILDAFTRFPGPVSAPELRGLLNMTANAVQKCLNILEDEGYLVRDASGELYQLGPQVLMLESSEEDGTEDFQVICRPYMEMLHDYTQESVFLSIIVGQNRVVVDKIEGSGRRIAHSQRGLAVPLHVGQASRALLACLPDDQIEAYLRQAPPLANYSELFTTSAGESLEDVWEDIRAIRRDKYIVWSNPRQYEGTYVAFPVRDGEGLPHAALSVGAPIERMSEKRLKEMLPEMIRIVEQLRARAALIPASPTTITKPYK